MEALRFRSCLCWSLKTGTLVMCSIILGSCVLLMLLHLLDIAALKYPFEIRDGFNSDWRRHVWEGWLACNGVMIVSCGIIITFSITMLLGVLRWPILLEVQMLFWYTVFLVCFIIIDLGVACYQYSWYGANTFRRSYLAFTFIFFLLRIILFTMFAVILGISRRVELEHIIKYGSTGYGEFDYSYSDLITSREYLNMRRAMSVTSSVPPGQVYAQQRAQEQQRQQYQQQQQQQRVM